MLKPAAAQLTVLLWALWSDKDPATSPAPKPGLVSIAMESGLPHAYYYAAGYRPSGERAVRIDMLERLAQLIRSEREKKELKGAFEATAQMMSLVGCSGEEFEAILRSLGFKKQTIKRPPPPAAEAASDAETSSADARPPTETVAATPAPSDPERESAPAPAAQTEPTPELTPQAAPEAAPQAEPEATSEAGPEAGSDAHASDTAAAASEPPAPPSADAAQEKGEETRDGPLTAAALSESDHAQSPAGDKDAPSADEMVVWRFQPRRPRAPRQSGDARVARDKSDKNAGGGREGRSDRPRKEGYRKGGKGPKKNDAPKRYTAGPKRSAKADPDSPFAVLAALKAT